MTDKKRENIFEILDGMMDQLSKTKRMFMFMILTVLILPPVALLVLTAVFDPPVNQQASQVLLDAFSPEIIEGGNESGGDESGEHGSEESDGDSGHLVRLPQFMILVISLVWLGIGIRQWIVVSKWDKKYQRFKEQQKNIERELQDDSKDADE